MESDGRNLRVCPSWVQRQSGKDHALFDQPTERSSESKKRAAGDVNPKQLRLKPPSGH